MDANPIRQRIPISVLLLIVASSVIRGTSQCRAADRQLVVVCPHGSPAVHASVTLLAPLKPGWSYPCNGDLDPPSGPGMPRFHTDEHGHVSVPDGPVGSGLLVLHAQGYAERVRVPESGTVNLLPWGRVTGQLRLSGGRMANQPMRVRLMQTAPHWQIFFLIDTRSDAQGRFTFDRLPAAVTLAPPPTRVPGLDVTRVAADGAMVQSVDVVVRPGQTTTVTVGGTGRAVVGRAVPPAAGVGPKDWVCGGYIETVPKYPPPYDMPAAVANGPVAQREQWTQAFFQTDAGKSYAAAVDAARDSYRSYSIEFAPDGSFRVEGVPAEHYKAQVAFYARLPGSSVGKQFAAATAEFTVPPMRGGHDETPLELPPIDAWPEWVAAVGKPAPDFSLPALDGRPLRLSNYRGRYVVLDFWATWCGPCVAEMPNVRRLYDDVRQTGRVAFVGMSMDEGPAKALSYVRANAIPWDQAWVDDAAGKRVLSSYPSPNGIPQFWLIDPDGRVVAEGQRVEQLRSALVSALAGRPGVPSTKPVSTPP